MRRAFVLITYTDCSNRLICSYSLSQFSVVVSVSSTILTAAFSNELYPLGYFRITSLMAEAFKRKTGKFAKKRLEFAHKSHT